MRIGVLSGGGDAPGLNAVIRAVTKTAIFKYGWEVTGIIDGFEGLLSPTKTRQLTSWNTRGILFVGGTILGTIIGAFVMSVLTNGLRIMGVQEEWKIVVTGVIIIAAVYVDIVLRKKM